MSFREIKKLIDDLLNDISKIKDEDNLTIKKKIDNDNLKGIIDISLDDEIEIPKERFESKIVKDYRYRILKLDRPYKRSSMNIAQINISTLKMYANLCNVLEEELNKRGTSVARLVSTLRGNSSYYDIYYTIYRIAEAHVINFYNPMSNIDATRSYEILEDNTNTNIKNIVLDKAIEFSHNLDCADQETKIYFNLTENNKKSLWRDIDGSLREKYDLTIKEERAIDQISKRNNVLWKNNKVTDILLDMYIASVKASFDNDDINTINIITRVSPYTFSKNTLDSLLIYSESNIRDKFKFFTNINAEESIEILKEIDDGKFFDFIKTYQENYLNMLSINIIDDIYEDYFKNNPKKYKDRVSYITSFDIGNQIEILNKMSKSEDFYKVIGLLVKEDFELTKLIGLYYIYKNNENKKTHDNILFQIIKEENYEKFIELITKNELSLDLIKKIMLLKKHLAKKINVDSKKIEMSRVKLKETVEIVNQFFDGEDESESILEEDKIDDENIKREDSNYENILREIIKNGSISLDYISQIAMDKGITVNTYIGEINDYLYDYISDQSLIVKEDKVIIDEFYVEMIEELLDEN